MADTSSFEHGQFCWHEIATRDAPKAKAFYADLLGYEIADVPMPGDGGTYTMLRKDGGDVAGLYQMDGDQFEGVPPHWLSYVWVDDVGAAAEQAKELGGSLIAEPMEVPNVGSMAVLKDPTGAVVAIFHGRGHPGAGHRGMLPGAVAWNELVTPDTAAASTFYQSMFGWGTNDQEMPDGRTYTTYTRGEAGSAGMMAMEGEWWGDIPPHWMPYVAVEDCAACVSRAKELGGQVAVPPTEAAGVGTFSVVSDPTGATFSVIEFDAAMASGE